MERKAEKKGLKDEGSRTQVLLAGAIAGLVARFIIAPLDVVKIRLQLQHHSPSTSPPSTTPTTSPKPAQLYTTTLSTLHRIYATEGLTALWRGNIPASYLYISYSALQFTFYTSTSSALHSLSDTFNFSLSKSADSFISGATAGAGATICTYPLDLLRTRFAAQGNERVYQGVVESVRTILKDEGTAGFFRGSSAAVAQIVPYMGTFFLLYESLRAPLSSLSLPFSSSDALSGVLASVVSKSFVFPLDLVRKRLQVQGPTRGRYVGGGVGEYRGVLGTVGKVVAEDGAKGLYRGLSVSLWKAAPASAVTMWVYERSLVVMRGLGEEKDGEREP